MPGPGSHPHPTCPNLKSSRSPKPSASPAPLPQGRATPPCAQPGALEASRLLFHTFFKMYSEFCSCSPWRRSQQHHGLARGLRGARGACLGGRFQDTRDPALLRSGAPSGPQPSEQSKGTPGPPLPTSSRCSRWCCSPIAAPACCHLVPLHTLLCYRPLRTPNLALLPVIPTAPSALPRSIC